MLANYKSMYPELSGNLPYVSEELEMRLQTNS